MAKRQPKEDNAFDDLIEDLGNLQVELQEEAERRSRLGGYSADAGTIEALCGACATFAQILGWVVKDMKDRE